VATNRDRSPRPIKPITALDETQIRTHARLMAIIALGHDDDRVDSLARQLAHRALSYGRNPDYPAPTNPP
jgi:hypothetical protein